MALLALDLAENHGIRIGIALGVVLVAFVLSRILVRALPSCASPSNTATRSR